MDPGAFDNLRDVLTKAARRLQEYRDVYQGNETAVREKIVLPILRGLGWNTESPAEVHPEDRSDAGSPDYTLKSNGRGVVTIEVKKAAVEVAVPGALEQAHRYASAKGVGLCLATNGETWVLARSFEEGRDLRGRILWQALLSEGTVDDVAQKLSFVARTNVASIDEFVQLQDMIAEKWDELLSDPTDLVAALVTLLKKRLPSPPERLPYVGFIEAYVSQRVREMISPDGHDGNGDGEDEPGNVATPPVRGFYRENSAAGILVQAAERAIKEGRLMPNASLESGHTRYLVSPKPVHKNGKQFFSPRRLSNGLYLESHSSIANAKRLAAMLDGWNRGKSR